AAAAIAAGRAARAGAWVEVDLDDRVVGRIARRRELLVWRGLQGEDGAAVVRRRRQRRLEAGAQEAAERGWATGDDRRKIRVARGVARSREGHSRRSVRGRRCCRYGRLRRIERNERQRHGARPDGAVGDLADREGRALDQVLR